MSKINSFRTPPRKYMPRDGRGSKPSRLSSSDAYCRARLGRMSTAGCRRMASRQMCSTARAAISSARSQCWAPLIAPSAGIDRESTRRNADAR